MNSPIKEFDPKGPEATFALASGYINKGEPVKAAGLLASMIVKYPDYGRAYNHLGYLWETEFRDLSTAEDHYISCLRLSPEYSAVYYNYAALLSNLNRLEELEKLLGDALTVNGISESKIYNEFGVMYEKQGKYLEALESYHKAIQKSFSTKDIDTYRNSIQRIQEKVTLSLNYSGFAKIR